VGKSSLLTAVEPTLDLRTQTISLKRQEGRHTTSQAIMLPFAASRGLPRSIVSFDNTNVAAAESMPPIPLTSDSFTPGRRFERMLACTTSLWLTISSSSSGRAASTVTRADAVWAMPVRVKSASRRNMQVRIRSREFTR